MSKSVSQVRGVDDIIDEAGDEEAKIFGSEKEDLIVDNEENAEEGMEQMIESTKEGMDETGRKRF